MRSVSIANTQGVTLRSRSSSSVPILLGLDVGTTGTRAIAVDVSGTVLAQASASYPLSSPHPGWSEQNPEDWKTAAISVLGRVASDLDATRIVGLGLTGQMHGAVFLDDQDRVIRPALLWNDQRTENQCAEITARVGEKRLLAITGNPALTGFQAPKLLWLRDREPDAFARIARVLLPKDYLRLVLTGELATDVSDASGTLFLDVGKRRWSPEILDRLEVAAEWLPPVRESPEVTASLGPGISSRLGVSVIPVAAGAGDNAAAAIGTGIVQEGRLSSSIGTSGVLFAHAGAFNPDPSGRIHAFAHAVPAAYHLMAVTLAAGGALRWWRDLLAGGDGFETLSAAAEGVEPGAEGLLFLPYLTGERTPHRDAQARGAFFGLTARHGRAHLTRALMEGVCFSLREGLDIMRGLGVEPAEVRAIGGGARSRLWLQLQADIFETPVVRPLTTEGPAYGAALLGGIAAGVFRDVAEASGVVALSPERVEPKAGNVERYRDLYGAYQSLYPATAGIMHRLARLNVLEEV
jgi:xylulokinase